MSEQRVIDIQIGVLEVEGVSRDDAPRFRRDVERELAQLLLERGLDGGASDPRELVTATADIAPGAANRSPHRMAREVALAVYEVLRR